MLPILFYLSHYPSNSFDPAEFVHFYVDPCLKKTTGIDLIKLTEQTTGEGLHIRLSQHIYYINLTHTYLVPPYLVTPYPLSLIPYPLSMPMK